MRHAALVWGLLTSPIRSKAAERLTDFLSPRLSPTCSHLGVKDTDGAVALRPVVTLLETARFR